MYFVVVYDKKKFFGSIIDIPQMNKQLNEIQKDGAKIISITPAFNIFGTITSFTFVIDAGVSE